MPGKEGNDKRVALVTGANQGVGFQVAKELVATGVTVLVGSRNFARGEAAAKEIGPGAIALQFDVTDRASIAAAAERIRKELGRLDVLVQNAAISNTGLRPGVTIQEYAKLTRHSNVSLDEVRAIWETNVFGVLAVYQAMLPLLRESADARIVNVSSGVGSLTANADPAGPYHSSFGPGYSASKTALNAITLAMMVELESTAIKVNLVSPGFTKTNLNNYQGTASVEDGSREVVRVALLGPDEPVGYVHALGKHNDPLVIGKESTTGVSWVCCLGGPGHMTNHDPIYREVTGDLTGDVTTMAERELAAFFSAVTELFGSEQAEASVDDWLRELMASNDLPASPRQWRTLTVTAAAQLASRVNASAYQKRRMLANSGDAILNGRR